MKKLIQTGLLLLLAVFLPLQAVLPAYAEEELKYMAYNFYAAPDLSRTSKKFDSFMIDFRSDKTPLTTYWSLANFGMDLSSAKTRKEYPGITGYGAYAGLQNSNGKKGILSFWEASYLKDGEKALLRASRVYPAGNSTFGGEGEGTNCIAPYEWEADRWYRMLLHCWEDEERGTTFAGMWLMDVETGVWTLFAYFDTQLYDSYFTGAMSQFMENYWGLDVTTNCNVERTCNLKNMYVYDHARRGWVSLPTATLSYGDGNPVNEDQKKFGAHSFGATEEYFWGSTGGKVEDQEAYDAASTKHSTHTITQPKKPTLGSISIGEMKLENGLSWTLAEGSTPQLSYSVKVVDTEGNTVLEKSATRPEEQSVDLSVSQSDAVKCILTVTDVFGATTTQELATDAYKAVVGEEDGKGEETPTPSDEPSISEPSPESSDNDQSVEEEKEEGGFLAFIKSIFEAIANFFKNLFGGNKEEASLPPENE